jgi:hypothetical protein
MADLDRLPGCDGAGGGRGLGGRRPRRGRVAPCAQGPRQAPSRAVELPAPTHARQKPSSRRGAWRRWRRRRRQGEAWRRPGPAFAVSLPGSARRRWPWLGRCRAQGCRGQAKHGLGLAWMMMSGSCICDVLLECNRGLDEFKGARRAPQSPRRERQSASPSCHRQPSRAYPHRPQVAPGPSRRAPSSPPTGGAATPWHRSRSGIHDCRVNSRSLRLTHRSAPADRGVVLAQRRVRIGRTLQAAIFGCGEHLGQLAVQSIMPPGARGGYRGAHR